ncbi:MAG: hypothetical protein HY916_07025 [Desulfovibrio sp.]|jgi:hypothetical protein|nr:hypothetical protein [Desulfovibrio sp.]
MTKQTGAPRNFPCMLLVAALIFSSFFGLFPHPDEISVPLAAGHSQTADVEHSQAEHPDGIFEYPQAVVANGQGGPQVSADGSVSCVRSRHGLPLEHPPESSSHLS